MNKQFIFLTNQYLPKPGATGMCVHSVASELAKRGYSVSTICYSFDSSYHFEIIDDVNVYYIPVPFHLRDNNISSKLKNVYKILSRLSKLIYLSRYPLRSGLLVKRFYNKLLSIINRQLHVTIIASYTPLEAVVAMLKITKVADGVTTVFYSTDTLSNEKGNAGILPVSFRTKMGEHWEIKIMDSVNIAIIMECHRNHYLREVFKKYHNKMRFANFPLLKDAGLNVIKKSNRSYKKLVYAGTLYKDLRNPSYLCEVLNQVLPLVSSRALFLGGGDCDNILKSYENKSSGLIKFLGMQPYSIALGHIYDSDILLSIGNSESPMAPSKIYEYMSTGKPIIHTYSWEGDPCIEPLRRYGNCLLLNEHEPINAELIKSFIDSCVILSYDQVKSCFNSSTPEFTADLLDDLI